MSWMVTAGNSRAENQIAAGPRLGCAFNLARNRRGLDFQHCQQALQEYPLKWPVSNENVHARLAPMVYGQNAGKARLWSRELAVSPRWPLEAKLRPDWKEACLKEA